MISRRSLEHTTPYYKILFKIATSCHFNSLTLDTLFSHLRHGAGETPQIHWHIYGCNDWQSDMPTFWSYIACCFQDNWELWRGKKCWLGKINWMVSHPALNSMLGTQASFQSGSQPFSFTVPPTEFWLPGVPRKYPFISILPVVLWSHKSSQVPHVIY